MRIFEDLTPEELDMLALAVDFYICNSSPNPKLITSAENLLLLLDALLDEFEEDSSSKIIEKSNNLLKVDFGSKSD